MKLKTLLIGLFLIQFSFGQETTKSADTLLTPVVVKTQAEINAQRDQLKEAQKVQREKEKALKAEERARKAEERAQKKAQKAQERAKKAEEKAKKAEEKAQKNLEKANQEVLKIQNQIKKKQNELAREKNKYELKKNKSNFSAEDDLKFKGKFLKHEQKLNDLNAKLIKAQEKVRKYSR